MERMKVIAISGHARHGKDTVAQMLQKQLQKDGYTVLMTHYADLLKYICKTFFGWDGRKDEKGRSLLQYVGTDVVRAKNPDYWVDFVSDILNLFDGRWDYVIIPDTRFPNEFNRLKERGFNAVHLRVVRPDFASQLTEEQQTHLSETALNDIAPDYCIYNTGDLKELNNRVTDWLKEKEYAE